MEASGSIDFTPYQEIVQREIVQRRVGENLKKRYEEYQPKKLIVKEKIFPHISLDPKLFTFRKLDVGPLLLGLYMQPRCWASQGMTMLLDWRNANSLDERSSVIRCSKPQADEFKVLLNR